MCNQSTVRSAVAMACTLFAWSALSAQSPRLDACSVLTRDEIKTLSGNRDPGPPEPGGNSEPDVVTTCYWQRTSPKGSVSLWYKVSPTEPKGLALKQLLDRGKKARAIDGIGDDAVFLESSKEDPGGTLFVRVGHYRVVIHREADHPTATSESVLPLLMAFAKTAVPKLRKAG
ncbi:MAG TPA: hypothetical protein VJQ46_17630 [Gemmatimonadales bacterium]|nr:hypothetical protein [Gemmatimonadales bacterium]